MAAPRRKQWPRTREPRRVLADRTNAAMETPRGPRHARELLKNRGSPRRAPPNTERRPAPPLPSPTRFAVERPLDDAAAGAAPGPGDGITIAEIDARTSALRSEMAELDRLRRRVATGTGSPECGEPTSSLVPCLQPAPPGGADDDLAPRRAVDVVEHVLLDVIFSECVVEVEWELEGA